MDSLPRDVGRLVKTLGVWANSRICGWVDGFVWYDVVGTWICEQAFRSLMARWLCMWMGGYGMVGTWICELVGVLLASYKLAHGHMCSYLLEFINGNS